MPAGSPAAACPPPGNPRAEAKSVNPIVKEMSSISPGMPGVTTFDINVEDVDRHKICNYRNEKDIRGIFRSGRHILPLLSVAAARKAAKERRILAQNQHVKHHLPPWHTICKIIGHRSTANEVPNNSEEGPHSSKETD